MIRRCCIDRLSSQDVQGKFLGFNRRVSTGNTSKSLPARKPARDLSKLVHLRAGPKPISDARTATYVILSIGSGPGGRWFKSIRPDHFFYVRNLDAHPRPGGRRSNPFAATEDGRGGKLRLIGEYILGC